MAVIKSGASTDQWSIDAVSKAGRVTLYDSTGRELLPATPLFAKISISASGTIVAAVGGKKIRVLAYVLSFSGSVNAKFQSHVTPTDLTGLIYGAAGIVAQSGFSPVGHFETIVGEALDLNLSAGTAVGGHVIYDTI